MKYRFLESNWDNLITGELADEIENLDRAHKRAKRTLRQQQKAIDEKNEIIKDLELEIEALTEQLEWFDDLMIQESEIYD